MNDSHGLCLWFTGLSAAGKTTLSRAVEPELRALGYRVRVLDADELRRTDAFLRNTYGVDAAPYLRPPYGHHNATVDKVAAELGYQVPTLWSGDLRDSAALSEDQIVRMALQSFTPQNIVIGHLNHPAVTRVYGQLVDIIRARKLRTVTLNDVFLRPEIPRRTTGLLS